MMDIISFWINEEFYSVGVLAFLGVLIRVAVYINFSAGHLVDATESYGPFIQMFYTEPYILPNMLGCFMMGLFTTYKDEINRSSKGLYKGLTTGFCGSLTTFSSWMYVAFQTPFNTYNWYNILIMIVLESLMVWMCLILGMSAGKTIHEYSDYFFGPTNAPSIEVSVDISIPKVSQNSVDNYFADNMVPMKPIFHNPEQVESGDVESKTEPKTEPTKQLLPPKKQSNFYTEWMFWCVFFWIVALSLWITLLHLPYLSFFNHTNRRDLFRAVCLGPFGAWVRWALSRITLLSHSYPTLYPQTMLANTIAVLSETLVNVYSNSTWDFAFTQGFDGACSTVSTLFLEFHDLQGKRGVLFALRYGFLTFSISMIIIQIIVSA
eukprot:gene14178-15676_t